MSEQEQSQFDDPALKTALRRAYGSETAPPALRRRITSQLAEASAAHKPVRWFGSKPLKTLLAACLAIVAVGVAAYQIRENVFPPEPPVSSSSYGYNTDLPATFASEMSEAADDAAESNTSAFPVTNPASLASTLGNQIGVPVLAVADLGNGWHLRSACTESICNIKSASLVYVRNSRPIVLISIRASAVYQAPNGAVYSQTVGDHLLSGFHHGTGLYCLVAHQAKGGPTLADLNAMRDRLRQSSVVPSSCDPASPDLAPGP